jgi:hypothetical protein
MTELTGFGIVDRYDALEGIPFNKKYTKLFNDAKAPIANFWEKLDVNEPVLDAITAKVDPHLDYLEANAVVKEGKLVMKEGASQESFDAAMKAVKQAETETIAYLKGGKHKVGDVEHTVSEPLKKAFAEAEAASNKIVKPATSVFGMVRTQGWSEAVKGNYNKVVNGFKAEGYVPKGKAFAHSSLLVGSAVALGDAAFRSKTKDGEDRSASGRVIEAVCAGATGAFAVVGGRATALAR